MFGRSKVEKRLSELEEAFEKLQRAFKNLELEWLDHFDKSKRVLMRIVKRAQIVENAERAEEEAANQREDAPGRDGGGGPGQSLDPVSQRILARRRRLGWATTKATTTREG